MEAHVAGARIVAEWLEADPRIDFVNWAELPSQPHYKRAKNTCRRYPARSSRSA
ncbi:MAG: PLP-dependent transferase [Terrimesophilobacter sp.]